MVLAEISAKYFLIDICETPDHTKERKILLVIHHYVLQEFFSYYTLHNAKQKFTKIKIYVNNSFNFIGFWPESADFLQIDILSKIEINLLNET